VPGAVSNWWACSMDMAGKAGLAPSLIKSSRAWRRRRRQRHFYWELLKHAAARWATAVPS
jgi:hypothetical protein